MTERSVQTESIEQNREDFRTWNQGISERHEIGFIKPEVLRNVLEIDFGANFENLSEAGKSGLAMYSERKRTLGAEEVWGKTLIRYDAWTSEFAEQYENEPGNKLAKMINVADLKNEERKASESKNVGMKSYLRDITAYAAGVLSFDNLKLILGARAENGFIGAMTAEEKGNRKKIIIEWDREVDPEKGPLTKDPRESRLHPGEFIPEDKQEIRPASFPPGFPTVAMDWLKNN